MKKIFFQKCSLNYIFFLLQVIANFISISLRIDYPEENIEKGEKNIYNSSIEMINIYLITLCNFFGFIPYCLLKRSFKGNVKKDEDKLNENEKGKELIYNNFDVNEYSTKTKKILIYSFLVAIFDFLAEFCYLLFYIIFPNLISEFYEISCTVAFSVVIQFILSYLILKIHFYKLQKFTLIINIIIFFIMLIFDLINIIVYKAFDGEIYGVYFLIMIFRSLEYTFVKKAFLDGFLTPYNLLIFRGIYMVFLSLLFSGIVFFIDKRIFIYMPYFFSDAIYILRLIGFLIFHFFHNLFAWIIIDRFSPNYLPLCFIFEDICFFVAEKLDIRETRDFNTIGWDIYIRFFLFIILLIVTLIHNEIIIINLCGLSSDAKYFMDLKVESENIYSITDDPETLKRYETLEEMDNNQINE